MISGGDADAASTMLAKCHSSHIAVVEAVRDQIEMPLGSIREKEYAQSGEIR